MAGQLNLSRVNFREVAFVKLRETAYAPCYATQFSAGLDLRADVGVTVPAQGQAVVATGVAFQVPLGHYGRLASRSGLAISHQIHVAAGVIDPDYTGEIQILLLNLGDHPFDVIRGARVAQIIFEQLTLFQPVQRSKSFLGCTERGIRGFGSSDHYMDATITTVAEPVPVRLPLLPDPYPSLPLDLIRQWSIHCSADGVKKY
jgi:dUTP pyrophosphatase